MRSTIITDEGRLRREVAALLRPPAGDRPHAFAFDVESSGDFRGVPHLANVTWISIASWGGAFVVPMGHPKGTRQIGKHQEPRPDKNGKVKNYWVPDYEDPPKQLKPHVVFEILEPLFFHPDIIKIADEISYDAVAITKYLPGPPVPPFDDPKITDQLIDENLREYGLKPRTKTLLGLDYDKHNTGRCVEKFPLDEVARYSYMDASSTWLRWTWGLPQIAEQGLTVPHQIERDLIPVLIDMRLEGAPVNMERLTALRDTFRNDLIGQEARVYQAVGARFNINSVQQKQQILFSHGDITIHDKTNKREFVAHGQGIKPGKLTKVGKDRKKAGETLDWSCYSSADDVLEHITGNKFVDALRDYGDTDKLLSTYVEAWLGVEGTDTRKAKESLIYNGRIHTHFKQYGTVTGRFSSAAPNLQNIPRSSTEYGKLLRGIFEAPDGWDLIVADYGQIELVVLAHLIGFGRLYDGFWAGIDPHTVHAAGVLDKLPAVGVPGGITKDERQKYGKTLGFTIVNGAGDVKVGSMIGGSPRDGAKLLKKHEREFPEVYDFKGAVYELAREREPVPYVRTLMGRKRRIKDMNDGRDWVRAAAERQCFNTLIQGGAADLIKLSMIAAHRMLKERRPEARLILTVHDEIVAMSPSEYSAETKAILIEAMTGPHIQKYVKVPLSVEAEIAKNWGDAK